MSGPDVFASSKASCGRGAMRCARRGSSAMFLQAALILAACSVTTGANAKEPLLPKMYALPERAVIAPVRTCESLERLDLADLAGAPTEIFATSIQPATKTNAEYCRVEAYVAPTIRFELRLPTTKYTGRYLQLGCSANCGVIRFDPSPACDALMTDSGAFAVAATDTGHTGNIRSTLWARDNRDLQLDFAERGPLAVSIAAKAIVAAFYGEPAEFSYFHGCSDGGREGMVMAQRHPDAFDGIVAGAPANYLTAAFLRNAWQQVKGRDASGALIITPSAARTLHDAVMRACDRLDGLEDGQLDDARACTFDPQELLCDDEAREQPAKCLSAAQVAAAEAFYQGPVDPDGRALSLGGLARGSELMWPAQLEPAAVVNFFRDMIYGSLRPGLKLEDIEFTSATLVEVMRLGAHYEVYDPDLRRFRDNGGKLIAWEGNADTAAGPHALLNYYQKVRDVLGGSTKLKETMRLFILPGVYHCRGGYMPYQANFLGALVNWVEADTAPDAIEAKAVKPDGAVRTRPIFAYPVATKYSGRGDPDMAESFIGQPPAREPNDHFEWAAGR